MSKKIDKDKSSEPSSNTTTKPKQSKQCAEGKLKDELKEAEREEER
jgi:hypothetical protein